MVQFVDLARCVSF
ncbi:TPA: hypothetical protein HIF62_003435 [Escherichia coli]|nr:hypothetical protein [Escherichia coli]